MKEYSPEYLELIREIIDRGDVEAAAKELSSLHPADIAELYQDLDLDQAEFLYKLLDEETAADVLLELDEDDRRKLLDNLPNEVIAKQIDHMETDDAVDLIQELDKEDQEEVLSQLDDVEQAGDIIDLMKYDEDTAGGLMGTEMIVVNENWSMPECIKEMRKQAEDMNDIYYVFVVDNEEAAARSAAVEKDAHASVGVENQACDGGGSRGCENRHSDRRGSAGFREYDLVAMPVIDSIGRLVGQITVDDVMDEVRESAERDYQLASGLSTDVETDDSWFAQTKARLPWLLIGIAGGIFNSLILGNFEQGFATNPAMALFIPLIGGTGGNVGIQSSAIVVQGLANGSLEIARASRQILKEVGVGLLNASIIALLVFVYNCLTLGATQVTTVAVSLSLFAVVIFASVFGTFVPLTLERLKIDPALATGPFISITNDIIGMAIYMTISSWFLSQFGTAI